MLRRRLALAFLLVGCGESPLPTDAGPASGDASIAPDAAPEARDAGLALDAGPPPDAGLAIDAGAAQDAGFAPDASAPDAGPPDAGPPPPCEVTLCMAGAFTRNDAANPWFEDLCVQLPGLVRDGNEALFMFSARNAVLEALVAALDDNGDGRVDAADPACRVRLVGHSWGGVNCTRVAQDFADDDRVASERATIHELYTLDPYAPTAGRTVEIAANVEAYFGFRHSSSPPDDCSRSAPLGPFEGLPPRCFATSRCFDYDYSLAPARRFTGVLDTYRGDEIGHCRVVDVGSPAVLHMIRTGQPFADLPPTVAVEGR